MSTELDKAREALTSEERLTIALTGIPDDIAPDIEAKRGAWNVCSYVLVKMLDGLGDLAPNRFSYVFSYDDSERYEIQVHRVRGESQIDALAKSNAALERALEAVDRLTAALADAEATIANERGEGEPPEPGWAWAEGAWDHERGTVVGRDEDDRWCFAASDGVYLYPEPNTARAAMRAATTATETK
jgi:hypothetical protein